MGVFDQAARFAAQADPEAVVRRVLAATKTPLRFTEWADTRTLPRPGGTERTADLVAVLADAAVAGSPWLLVLEFQARHDPDKLDVILEEVARLRLHGRHGQDRQGKYRVLTGLVYLQGRCPESVLDMRLPEGFGTQHTALLWNVEGDVAEAMLNTLEAGEMSWGVLFWVPLMAGGADEAVIARWKEKVLAIEDRRRCGDLGQVALVFAELAGRYGAWERGLEGFDMTDSQVVNRWVRGAVEQNSLDEARGFLIRLLEGRFPGQIMQDVMDTINAQPSRSMLVDWFDQANRAANLADFLRVLRA
jgi:hypothetical protein